MARFSEVLTIVNGKNQSKVESPNGRYPIYGSGGIMGYADSYLCKPNTVVIGRKGSINKPIFVETHFWNVDTAFGLEAKTDVLLPKYLYYFCVQFDFEKLNTTVTIPSLTKANLLQIDIPVPSIDEQREIVDSLDKVERLISLRKKQLQKLDDLIKTRFVEMFGDPVNYKGSLSVLPMTDICTIIDGDRGENYPKQEDFSISGYCLFLNAKNVTKNGFDYSNCMYISKAKDDVLRKGKLQRGDIVLTTRGTIGNLAFYSKDVPFDHVRINSGMVLLRMKGMMEEQFFIEQFRMLLDDIRLSIASGSAQPQLPISTMNKIMMIVPNKEKQRQFVEILEAINKTKSSIQAGLDKLEQMKQALMQKYFA